MNEEEIDAKEAEIKRKYPASLSHTELKEGEILLGEFVVDFAFIQVGMYKKAGLSTARMGDVGVLKPIKWHGSAGVSGTSNVLHYPIFANLREAISVQADQKTKK